VGGGGRGRVKSVRRQLARRAGRGGGERRVERRQGNPGQPRAIRAPAFDALGLQGVDRAPRPPVGQQAGDRVARGARLGRRVAGRAGRGLGAQRALERGNGERGGRVAGEAGGGHRSERGRRARLEREKGASNARASPTTALSTLSLPSTHAYGVQHRVQVARDERGGGARGRRRRRPPGGPIVGGRQRGAAHSGVGRRRGGEGRGIGSAAMGGRRRGGRRPERALHRRVACVDRRRSVEAGARVRRDWAPPPAAV